MQKWGCWNREAWMWLQYLVCLHVTECVIDKSSFQVFVYGIFEVFSIFLTTFPLVGEPKLVEKWKGNEEWRGFVKLGLYKQSMFYTNRKVASCSVFYNSFHTGFLFSRMYSFVQCRVLQTVKHLPYGLGLTNNVGHSIAQAEIINPSVHFSAQFRSWKLGTWKSYPFENVY